VLIFIIKNKKEIKMLYKLIDYSYLKDEHLTEVYFDINQKPLFKIVEEGLKIPYITQFSNEINYNDTMVEYDGKKYFTKKEFLVPAEPLYKLIDFSWLMDENYNFKDNVLYQAPIFKIVEENLRIPINNSALKRLNLKFYHDTMVEYEGKKYFTKKEWLKEI
jgi:hypothetical protein